MLCQTCKKKEALIHISTGSTPSERRRKSKHFCRQCADAYYIRAGMNSARDLIRLSEFYRSKLYDELEVRHPEAFDNSDDEACRRSTRTASTCCVVTSLVPAKLMSVVQNSSQRSRPMTPNRALLPDAFGSLRCACGAAKRGR
jgi:protein-arginine kinase activator protein McsA